MVETALARRDDDGKLVVEDAEILFRNFSGKEGKYNQEGQKNFCLILTPENAAAMEADGWNVKYLKARDEGDEPKPYIQVSVGFNYKPPRMVLITSRGRVALSEDECELFDWVDIQTVDLIVRPYHWSVNGNSGIKAYLQSMYLTMQEDYLDMKYASVPEVERAGGEDEIPALSRGTEEFDETHDIVDAEIVEEG